MHIGLILLMVSSVIWMEMTSKVANSESPIVFYDNPRVGYTSSELTAMQTLSSIGAGTPLTDTYYNYTFPILLSNDSYNKMIESGNQIFIQRNYFLHHPEWNQMYITSIRLSTANYQFIESGMVSINEYVEDQNINRWSVVYVNNNVKVYSNSKE